MVSYPLLLLILGGGGGGNIQILSNGKLSTTVCKRFCRTVFSNLIVVLVMFSEVIIL